MSSIDRVMDVVRNFVTNHERKHRNLVKRKSKLDQYRDRISKGESLNEEQRKAVEGYEGVLQSIVLVQEFVTQSKELLDDVVNATAREHSELERTIEQNTLSFLHTQLCLQRLLDSLDSTDIRLLISKLSSEHHLKLLDTVKALISVPFIDNWPKPGTNSMNKTQEFIESHSSLTLPSRYAYDFVIGRPVPVPVPENYEGSQKKFNFREARTLCFRLLATPALQRLLYPSDKAADSSSHNEVELEMAQSSSECTDEHHLLEDVKENTEEADIISPPEQKCEEVYPSILDNVIKPLGGTFNFLQVSNVEPSSGRILEERMNPIASDAPKLTDEQFDVCQLEENFFSRENGDTEQILNPTLNSSHEIHSVQEENLHGTDFQAGITDVELPKFREEPISTPETAKPISYADLLRRSSGQGRPKAVSHEPSLHTVSVQGGKLEPAAPNSVDEHDIDRRSSESMKYHPRGGRGRGYQRGGTVSGMVRRPNGGSRPHRFLGGRGNGSFRGGPTGVAQPSY